MIMLIVALYVLLDPDGPDAVCNTTTPSPSEQPSADAGAVVAGVVGLFYHMNDANCNILPKMNACVLQMYNGVNPIH